MRPVWRAHPIGQRGRWQATIGALWDGASYREHRYAALDLLATKVGAAWHDRDLLPLLEHLIVTGAWWDYVDDIATHHVRAVLLADPATTVPVIRAWAVAPDLWLRRTALIAQVGAKDHTDLDLLAFVITANAADPHFFCRKAIGWALREYAWTDPDWVRSFVDQHEESLSPLSRAQALKNLTP